MGQVLKLNTNKGFTLIELSIVIVIIGLIVAGVVGGQTIVRQAKVRAVITDYNNVKVALNAFKLEYDAIPGDFNRAQAYWPAATSGNGNKQIFHYAQEGAYAWDHLEYAELFPGSFTGAASGPGLEGGVNMPFSSFGGNVAMHFGYVGLASSCHSAGTSPVFGVIDDINVLYVGTIESASVGCPRDGFLKVSEAHGMDTKIDDGLADSGFLYSLNTSSSNTDGDRCVDKNASGTGGANYDFNETGENCRLIFNMDG